VPVQGVWRGCSAAWVCPLLREGQLRRSGNEIVLYHPMAGHLFSQAIRFFANGQ
jgi:hypothetical protein